LTEVKTVTALEQLRRDIHAAVDGVLDTFFADSAERGDDAEPAVLPGDAFGRWRYTWPDKQDEEFSSGRLFTVRANLHTLHVRLAWTTRRAWGRERGRAIVFQQLRGGNSYYPLAEFVETDDPGRFASPIPDPNRPRALLTDLSNLPSRLSSATVERADALFRSIEKGPSLRIVVGHDDEADMVRHAYWVARLRGRIPP
jgi:hypothetical protein